MCHCMIMEQRAFFVVVVVVVVVYLWECDLLPELRLCAFTLKFRGFPDLVAHQVDADEKRPARRVSKQHILERTQRQSTFVS